MRQGGVRKEKESRRQKEKERHLKNLQHCCILSNKKTSMLENGNPLGPRLDPPSYLHGRDNGLNSPKLMQNKILSDTNPFRSHPQVFSPPHTRMGRNYKPNTEDVEPYRMIKLPNPRASYRLKTSGKMCKTDNGS